MKNTIIIILALVIFALAYGYLTPEEVKDKIEETKNTLEEKY